MRQVLVDLWGFKLHAYATMLSLSFVLGTLLAVREGDKRGMWLAPEGGLWIFFGALLGAKVFWYLQFDPTWYTHPWRMLLIWNPGVVYYGGLIGGVVAGWLYTTIQEFPRLKTADVVVPYLALGQAITRVGCFLNGCCFGKPSDVPWAVQFPKGGHAWMRQEMDKLLNASDSSVTRSLPVHPTQLYMVAGLVVMVVVLKWALSRKRFDGQVGLLYLFFYGLLRFVVEFYRGDSVRSVFGMTVSQALSLGMVLVAVVLLGIAWKRGLWHRRPVPAGGDGPQGEASSHDEPEAPAAASAERDPGDEGGPGQDG